MKIHKLVLILLTCLLSITSCKKKEAELPVGKVPEAFIQNVLIEENTGEWCGWCAEGALVLKDVINLDPNRVIAVSIHDGDPMEVSHYNDWQIKHTKVGGFPNGSIQRGQASGRLSWEGQTSLALTRTAECGLAIVSNLTHSILNVDVYVGYQSPIVTNTMLTVLIVEDEVPQSFPGAQSNYSPVVVDDSWRHHHVVRAVLSEVAGNPIDLGDPDKKYVKASFNTLNLNTFPIADYSNCKIVAFINLNDGSLATHNNNVLNVQSAKLNKVKNWDYKY